MHLHHGDKVILFPKWKQILERESLSALKDKNYEEALSKLNQLISYRIENHEIMTGKLICLMELGKWTEAQSLCEDLISEEDDNYYNYVHIYLTILFQTSQYSLLMEQVEYEIQKNNLPEIQRKQFLQLHDISEKMNMDITVEKEKVIFQQLFKAVEEGDFVEQWRQVERLKVLHAEPTDQVIDLLKKESVHPLAKTAITSWLRELDWSKSVEIIKFNLTVSIIPNELEEIENSEVIQETIPLLKEIEQDNPSLYHLIYQLLYHYTYVLYPIKPPDEDYVYIARALEIIGSNSLGILPDEEIETNTSIDYYIEKIKLMESLYLSIIEG